MCSIEDVETIHKKLQTLLGQKGAYLDDIVFCPHHPDKGYPEENPLYKVECNCRKPATGMIDRMIERYNIDPAQSYMIGDSTIDIQTGINAGLHTVLVRTGQGGRDGKYNVNADVAADDLLAAVSGITG
jgi:histidinol-phosphate phosphatase family protein